MKNNDLKKCKDNINPDISLKERTWSKIQNYNVDTAKFTWKSMSVTAACVLIIFMIALTPVIMFKNRISPPVGPVDSQSEDPATPIITGSAPATDTSSFQTDDTSSIKTTETVPTQTVKPGSVKLSKSVLNSIEELMNENGNWNFLTCIYNNPSEIDLDQVLHNCEPIAKDISNEDDLELIRLWGENWQFTSCDKLLTEDINNFLFDKTGLRMKDINRKLTFTYSERLNAYYWQHGDTNIVSSKCISGEKSEENGIYTIKYEAGEYGGRGFYSTLYYTVTFKLVDNKMLFISNMPTPERTLTESELKRFEDDFNVENNKLNYLSKLYSFYEYRYNDETLTKVSHGKITVKSGITIIDIGSYTSEGVHTEEDIYMIEYFSDVDVNEIYTVFLKIDENNKIEFIENISPTKK